MESNSNNDKRLLIQNSILNSSTKTESNEEPVNLPLLLSRRKSLSQTHYGSLKISVPPSQIPSFEPSDEKRSLLENNINGQHYKNISQSVDSCTIRFFKSLASQAIPTIFAVFINLLDACTFGSVFFPRFVGNTAGLVVELFIISTIISQVLLIMMSSFDSGIGTSMAENIPFVHTMSSGIYLSLRQRYHSNDSVEISQKLLPTILVTVALSTIINGILFVLVGVFKLGNILHYFPRYVILGMTAGFGIFLMGTAFEISSGLPMVLTSFHALSHNMYTQLMVVLSVESFLRVANFFNYGEIFVSCVMLSVPLIFYLVLYVTNTSFEQARDNNWLFPLTESFKWYETWSVFKYEHIDWYAIWGQFPTIFSLAFFTIILVPVRIPSLSLITGEEVNFDNELIAQGMGNIAAGLVGSPHNYLSYSNSVFYHVLKGRGNYSRSAICVLTAILFIIGPQILNYAPRMIAGIIILHLAIDLIIGALYNSSKTLDGLEYLCMLIVGTIVSILGFVQGMSVGILLACVTFVVASSRETNIRSIFSGNYARSDTEWSLQQRRTLDENISSGKIRILVIAMQGHLFFGNIQNVVRIIQGYLKSDLENYPHSELNFVVLDCSFVTGADINALSSLLKLKDRLWRRESNINTGTITNKRYATVFAGLHPSLKSIFELEAVTHSAESTKEESSNSIEDLETPKSFPRPAEDFFNNVNGALHAVEELALKMLPESTTRSVRSQMIRASFRFDDEVIKSDIASVGEFNSNAGDEEEEGVVVINSVDSTDLNSSPRKSVSLLDSQTDLQKHLMDSLLELGSHQWEASDAPIMKRLVKRLLLYEMKVLGVNETLWKNGSPAIAMALLLTGRLQSVSKTGTHRILAPAIVGLGCMTREKYHTRTLASDAESYIIMIPSAELIDMERKDKAVLSILQSIVLRSLYLRQKHETLLFNAGSFNMQKRANSISDRNSNI
eukprot:gene4185-5956_t